MFDVSSFAYDQQAPLEFTVLSERVQDGAVIQDITNAAHNKRTTKHICNDTPRGCHISVSCLSYVAL